jgi:hypothetical protein
MGNIIVTYPLDYRGILESNATKHPITLGTGTYNRAFAYPTGPFFTKGFRLVEANRPNVPLVRGTDYELVLLSTELTKKTTQEVASAIVVFNPAISTDVVASGNIIGGPWASNISAIEQAINALDLDDRQVDFTDLTGVPDVFMTAPAYADIGDIFGFEYVTTIMGEMLDVMKAGNSTSAKQIEDILANIRKEFQDALDAHIDADGNVHSMERSELSLMSSAEIGVAIQAVMTEFNKLAALLGQQQATDVVLADKLTAIVASIQVVAQNVANQQGEIQRNNASLAVLLDECAQYESKNEILSLDLVATKKTLTATSESLRLAKINIADQGEAIGNLEQAVGSITNTTLPMMMQKSKDTADALMITNENATNITQKVTTNTQTIATQGTAISNNTNAGKGFSTDLSHMQATVDLLVEESANGGVWEWTAFGNKAVRGYSYDNVGS